MNNDEMVKSWLQLARRMGWGGSRGEMERFHCGVDEEELVSNYKHGDDARKASQPWNVAWRIIERLEAAACSFRT